MVGETLSTWEWDCGLFATVSVAVWSLGGSIESYYIILRPVHPAPFFRCLPLDSVGLCLEDEVCLHCVLTE